MTMATTATKDPKLHRSIFELSPDFFDSCHLLQSPFISIPDEQLYVLQQEEEEIIPTTADDGIKSITTSLMQRWSCNTCKAEFDSLLDQRFHFKSDLHRFNIKLSVAGKNTINEEDFDASDSLCRDHDVSSISGSDDEDDRDFGRRQHDFGGGVYKNKLFIQLLAEATESQKASSKSGNSGSGSAPKPSGSALLSKEEELQRAREAERDKRAAAAERRMAALKTQSQGSGSVPGPTNITSGIDGLCSCCSNSLAGVVPFHRYNYKYCSSTCMHLHREILEDG